MPSASVSASSTSTPKRPLARRIFLEAKDGLDTPQFRNGGCPFELLRWSKFKNEPPERMYESTAEEIFNNLDEPA